MTWEELLIGREKEIVYSSGNDFVSLFKVKETTNFSIRAAPTMIYEQRFSSLSIYT